jgi:hypothetical protein
MSLMDYDKLITSLVSYLEAAAGITSAPTARATWAHSAVEENAADPYSVIRLYGGETPWVPAARASVQIKTVGKSVAASMAQAGKLFNGFLDANGRPARNVVILAASSNGAGVRLVAADPKQPPSFLSRDERGRAEVVFNVDLRVTAA